METSQTTNLNGFNKKYKFPLERISDSLRVQRTLSGLESYVDYRRRVRDEIGSAYGANLILRHRSPWIEADFLGISVRSVQRYMREFPFSDTFLELVYKIQISQL